jgi:hypothetical protein
MRVQLPSALPPISCRPTAGRRTVNPAMEVRVLPRERHRSSLTMEDEPVRDRAPLLADARRKAWLSNSPSSAVPAPPVGTRSLSPTDRQAAYEAADAGSTPARGARARLAQRQSSPSTPGRPAVRVRHRVLRMSPRRWQSGRLRLAVDQVPRTRWFESIPAHWISIIGSHHPPKLGGRTNR